MRNNRGGSRPPDLKEGNLDYFIENGFKNYQYYPVEILEKMELEKKRQEEGYQYTIEEALTNY